jgi:DNA polymerase-3 subunit epsilon
LCEHVFVSRTAAQSGVQLTLGGADGLVALLDERQEPVGFADAAEALFALRAAPADLAARLVRDVVGGDARLVELAGDRVRLAQWDARPATPIEAARFVVVDLETTGTRPGDRIIEIGAVRMSGLEAVATFERIVDPGVPLPATITSLTGLRERDVRRGEPIRRALPDFLAFAAGATLVAHNARFDIGFLNRALMALEGRRLAAPVLDTVLLARKLLAGRLTSCSLATLSDRFSTSVRPCHRALPDAQATAEVLAALLGRAQERGVETVEDAISFAASAPRRARSRRGLAHAVPPGPGVYVFRDARGQALYVGKARDLRTRVRSYFGARRQKPALEAALLALDRIEVAPLGSELEAGLAELSLIQRWRPPANTRSARPDRYAYLRLGLADPSPALGVRAAPRDDGALYAGPFRTRRAADEAAAALRDAFGLRTCRPRVPRDDGTCLRGLLGRCHAPCRGAAEVEAYGEAVQRLRRYLEGAGEAPRGLVRERVQALAAGTRFEEAARQSRRVGAVETIDRGLATVRRARSRSGVIVAAGVDGAVVRVLCVRGGELAAAVSVPRRGDPSSALGGALRALEPALPAAPRQPAVRAGAGECDDATLVAASIAGPWMLAERYDAAVLLCDALAGRDPSVVGIALRPGDPPGRLVPRIVEARARVQPRPPLPPGRWRAWHELRQVEA